MVSAWNAAVLGSLLLIAGTGPVGSQEWTRFRGPNGSGLSDAATIPVRWTEKDYNWKVELPGAGHSSPVLWGERLFITCAEEQTGKRMLLCLRADNGERLWTRELAGEKHGKHQDNSFASATPAVDERRVYVCWGGPKEYLVVAVDHAGNEVWRTELGSFSSGHGFGPSPIVHDGLVIVPCDQDGGNSALFALDCTSGKIAWKVPRRSKATYTTPCVYQPKGRLAELIFTSYEHGVTSIDPKTGKLSWELDVFNKSHIETGIGSPVVAGDLVFATCGWLGVRQEVVAVQLPGEGETRAREVFRLDRSAPLCTTPLVKGDLLFLWSDGGVVTCANRGTGDVHWRERVPGSYYGSPVCVGDYLYGPSREGEVVVLAASLKYELAASNPLPEGTHSSPAVANGRMYLRTFSHLVSIGGKKLK
jgi:outer membrane protein assembly factor BamB